MTLSEWLDQTGLKKSDFALAVPCARAHVYRYLNGERTPNKERIHRIFVLTGGDVTADDWMGLATRTQYREPEEWQERAQIFRNTHLRLAERRRKQAERRARAAAAKALAKALLAAEAAVG